jgi:FkbM family methyltransferase
MTEKWNFLRSHEAFRKAPIITLLRLLAWRLHCWLGKPATITLPKWDLRMHLPAEWRGFARLMFAFREMYEPELLYLDRLLSPGMTFVDVGACYGVYTLVAAKLVGAKGRVIAFEPASRSYAVLQENIKLNGLANVRPYRVALSDRIGFSRLYHQPDPGRNSLGVPEGISGAPEEVETNTLDSVLGSGPSERVDVMKLDVEGAEELVFRGAREILTTAHPAIIFEVNPEAVTALGLSPRGAWDILDRMGYSTFRALDGNAPIPLRVPPEFICNLIALHSTKGI